MLKRVVSVLTQRVKVLCVHNQPISAGTMCFNNNSIEQQRRAPPGTSSSMRNAEDTSVNTHTHTARVQTMTSPRHTTDALMMLSDRRDCDGHKQTLLYTPGSRGHERTLLHMCTADSDEHTCADESLHYSTSYTSYLISIYFVFTSLMLLH